MLLLSLWVKLKFENIRYVTVSWVQGKFKNHLNQEKKADVFPDNYNEEVYHKLLKWRAVP